MSCALIDVKAARESFGPVFWSSADAFIAADRRFYDVVRKDLWVSDPVVHVESLRRGETAKKLLSGRLEFRQTKLTDVDF
jgi:hypothetical protein